MEDFGYQKITNNIQLSRFIKRSLMIGATFFSIGCFLYITISAYHYVNNIDEKNIKIIKAPTSPIKVYAKSKTIATKDNKVIYQDILEKKEIDNIEKSQIVPVSKLVKPSNMSQVNLSSTNQQLLSKDNVNPVKVRSKSKEKIIIYDNTKPQNITKILDSKSDRQKIAEAKKNLNNKSRSIKIQVAALASYESAQISWEKLKRLYPELLFKQKYYIKKADLGKRGVFYRLQIGDFYNQIKAEEFCSKYILKANKTSADCIIVE